MKTEKFPVKLTLSGLYMEARMHGEEKILRPKRVVISDKILDEDFDVTTLTEIEDIKMVLPIVDCRVHERGLAQVAYLEAALRNYNLAEGFRARLIGVYVEDPDDPNAEILYCVTHFPRKSVWIASHDDDGNEIESELIKESGPWIPTIADEKIIDILYGLFFVIGQATTVECKILDDVVHITIHTFREHIDHPVPHPNMPHLVNPEVTDFDRVLVKFMDEQNFHPSTLANFIRVVAPEIVRAMTSSGDGVISYTGNQSGTNGNINLALSQLLATRMKNLLTLSLSGDVSGSVTTNWGGNADINVSQVLATRMKNSITLSLSGDASGSVTTNWGSGATINVSNSYAANAGNANYASSAGDANSVGGKTWSQIQALIDEAAESGGDDDEGGGGSSSGGSSSDIVAKSLALSGYIHFKGGFVIEWGGASFASGKKKATATLPLELSTIYKVVCSDALSADADVAPSLSVAWTRGGSSTSSLKFVSSYTRTGVIDYVCFGKA